jgi:hypothetical protein
VWKRYQAVRSETMWMETSICLISDESSSSLSSIWTHGDDEVDPKPRNDTMIMNLATFFQLLGDLDADYGMSVKMTVSGSKE